MPHRGDSVNPMYIMAKPSGSRSSKLMVELLSAAFSISISVVSAGPPSAASIGDSYVPVA